MQAPAQKTRRKSSSPIANARVGLVDKESGEVIEEGSLIYVPRKARIKGFFMGMQIGFEDLAKAKLNGEAMSVMMLLISRMDYENEIRITQTQIGEILSMKKQNVSRAMKALREVGAIDDPDANKIVRLSPDIGWKGKVQNKEKREKELARRRRDGEEVQEAATSSASIH